jgi:hypothetical protein
VSGLHRSVSALSLLVGVGAVLSTSACNAATGASDLVLGDGSSEGSTAPASGGAGGAPATTSAGGAPSSDPATSAPSGQGGAGGATSEPAPPAQAWVGAPGVRITEIALYQGVKRDLMGHGSGASSMAPVVAGRDALVRVFTQATSAYDGAPVRATLDLGDGAPLVLTQRISPTSGDEALGSTVNFTVPGAAITPSASVRVRLEELRAPADANPAATWPEADAAPLGAKSAGESLTVKLVPIAYDADGSGRLPDTSPAQLKRYEDRFRGTYPIPSVRIEVRQPVHHGQQLSSQGFGWEDLLDAIGQLRESDGAPPDVYYFGIFSPADSLEGYCGGGCVAGLGNIAGPDDAAMRAAIGLGFTGDRSAETAAHEIGHTHGRKHAPCGGAQGVDASYPYDGGGVGVWGYDVVGKRFYAPSVATDIMGYCDPSWVSDYTYDALFERLRHVNSAKDVIVPEALANQRWERARVRGDRVVDLPAMRLRTPPHGEATTVKLSTSAGVVEVAASYFPYDHLDGGVVMWAASSDPHTLVEARGVKVAR